MDCCRPSRRQAIIWGGLAAAAPLAATAATAATASPASAQTSSSTSSGMIVADLEVATVTDTSVIITWFTGSATATDQYGFPAPVPADTELQIGLVDATTLTVVPGSLKTVLQDSTPTAYHYAEVTGLEPGTFYAYVALSGGQTGTAVVHAVPGRRRRLARLPRARSPRCTTPPGRYLFTLALSNDLHMGEGESGIIEDNWPPAFEQDPGLPPYPVVMLERDARRPAQARPAAPTGCWSPAT